MDSIVEILGVYMYIVINVQEQYIKTLMFSRLACLNYN